MKGAPDRAEHLIQPTFGDGHARLTQRQALVPRHIGDIKTAEGGVGILVRDEVLNLVEVDTVAAGQRRVRDMQRGLRVRQHSVGGFPTECGERVHHRVSPITVFFFRAVEVKA